MSQHRPLVAQRRHLPGLHPQLRRRQRRRQSVTSPASAPACRTCKSLGVDAIWINPWYKSPMADHGYDVADFREIDPLFGTLAEAEALIEEAHSTASGSSPTSCPTTSPTSTSWFRAALAAGPGSPERDRYVFRHGPRRGRRRSRPTTGSPASADRLGPGCPTAAVVPAPVRSRAAGPQLGTPRGAGGVRGHPAVLVRPRCRRIPHRCGARPRQAPRPARPAAPPGRGRRGPARRARPPALGPRRGARDLPRLAPGRRRVPRQPQVRRRGLGAQPRAARPLRPRRTACTPRSTSTS